MENPKDHDAQLLKNFEDDGVEIVRRHLSLGYYGDNEEAVAEMWLSEKERERDALEAEKRDLAREATHAARRANWIAASPPTITAAMRG